MKYLLLTVLFVTSCVTKSEVKNLETKINSVSVKESCTRYTLDLLLLAPAVANPSNFNKEGDFMQAQFMFVDLKTKREQACKELQELLKNESKN